MAGRRAINQINLVPQGISPVQSLVGRSWKRSQLIVTTTTTTTTTTTIITTSNDTNNTQQHPTTPTECQLYTQSINDRPIQFSRPLKTGGKGRGGGAQPMFGQAKTLGRQPHEAFSTRQPNSPQLDHGIPRWPRYRLYETTIEPARKNPLKPTEPIRLWNRSPATPPPSLLYNHESWSETEKTMGFFLPGRGRGSLWRAEQKPIVQPSRAGLSRHIRSPWVARHQPSPCNTRVNRLPSG